MYLAFALAILLRLHMEWMLPDMPPDKFYQLLSARQLSLGHGISHVFSHPDNLSQFNYQLISLWAPGYAVILAPLLWVGFDYFQAAFLVDTFGILIFFLSWLWTLQILRPFLRPWLLVFIPLYWAVAYSPFRLIHSTDLLSLAFFSLSWALLLRIAFQGLLAKGTGWGLIVWFALSSYMCCFFRFAYYPIAILMPVLLILYAFIQDRTKLWQSIIAFLLTGGLIGGQLLYQDLYANNVIYMNQYYPETQPRLYLEHLLKFDPIALNSFLHDFILKKAFGRIFIWFCYAFSLIVFLILGIGLRNFFFLSVGKGKKGKFSLIGWFLIFGLTVSLTLILFLSYLSIRYPIPIDGNWTFVQEPRYFSPVYLIIFLFICLLLFHKKHFLPKAIKVMGLGVIMIGFAFSLIFYVYSLTRYSLLDGKANMRAYYHFSQEQQSFLDNFQILHSSVPVVFTANKLYSPVSMFLAVEGAAMIPAETLLEKGSLQSEKPVILLIVVDHRNSEPVNQALEDFAKLQNGRKAAELRDANTDIWEIKVHGSNSGR
jgi:hypothetical protein